MTPEQIKLLPRTCAYFKGKNEGLKEKLVVFGVLWEYLFTF